MQLEMSNPSTLRTSGWFVAAALGFALTTAGCLAEPGSSGSFDRTLTVSGPVRLEVTNQSGTTRISTGEPGRVWVRGDYRVHAWLSSSLERSAEEIRTRPPVEQQGNLIRVGFDDARFTQIRIGFNSLVVNYDISVPAETELVSRVGAGNIEVRGMRGPARLRAGSGNIAAQGIGDDTQIETGSGRIEATNVAGRVTAGAGSGSITLSACKGEIRASTGSGSITITVPGSRITAKTGSGRINIQGAAADLRASSGSGSLTIEGNPAPNSYWDLRTGSGAINLAVPTDASFRLYARSHRGIHSDLPITIEEQNRREVRGRVGDGSARVQAQTGSGTIRLR